MISQLAFAKKGYLWRNMQNVAKRRTLPGKVFHNGYEKRESLAHRTATTSYPCCLPALGGFRGSWSCTTFPAANIVFLCRSANYPGKYARFSGNSSLAGDGSLLLVEAVEYKRKNIFNFPEFPNLRGSDHDHSHIPFSKGLIFCHYLPTGPTRRARSIVYAAFKASCYGNPDHRSSRISRIRRKHCGTLGAETGGISGIFLIGAFHDCAVIETYGSSDIEF